MKQQDREWWYLWALGVICAHIGVVLTTLVTETPWHITDSLIVVGLLVLIILSAWIFGQGDDRHGY